MTVEAQLQAMLAPLAGGGCWPVINNAATIVFPYIVFYEVIAVPEMLDNTGLAAKRYQIDCFARSYGQTKALAKSIVDTLSASTLTCVYLSSMDGEYNPVTKDYQVITEFKIWA